MRELIIASCNGKHFSKNEKVVAFNICEKNYPFNSTTYIEKLTLDKILKDDETCRPEHHRDYNIYNIGEYKVMGVIGDFAKIAMWERDDEIKN